MEFKELYIPGYTISQDRQEIRLYSIMNRTGEEDVQQVRVLRKNPLNLSLYVFLSGLDFRGKSDFNRGIKELKGVIITPFSRPLNKREAPTETVSASLKPGEDYWI